MSGVLQLEVPTPTLWPDIGPFGVLMPESGPGVLFVGSEASGVLQLEDDDVFLAPATTSTFLLTIGERGADAPSQIYVGGDPAPIPGYPILLMKPAGTGDPNDYVPVIRIHP
jgi:hypothetical protein